ncbi:MAG: SCP2 sterol-binding domain-containing protein, partial [Chlorobi bacterium]|nr:SCP2 sterol-binding domain-containing protein [Chlorobiota bacterium]
DLIKYDNEAKKLITGKKISIQFTVKNGPEASVIFENNSCRVIKGKIKKPTVILWFTSAAHLNRMFEGKANPIPLKGFFKLGFLQKEFTKITEKLEYYLKPELVDNPDKSYIELNTRMTLIVAAFSLPSIAAYDEKAKITASHIPDGTIQMEVLPDGPAVHITSKGGKLEAFRGPAVKPDAIMSMRDFNAANDFLNGKSNPFKAIASGEVLIKGIIPMLDNLSLILDKVQEYAE